jgi:uncharacterized protein (TIGR03066 family)
VASLPEPVAATSDVWPDLRPLLDRELSRLPEIYRAVLVLCDLEGKTRKEAAHQLGWVEGTVAGRLARAREMLVQRLSRHGLTLSSASLATALLENAASATLPNALACTTIEAAISFAAGNMAVAGLISTEVAGLTRGVLHAMFLTKLKMLTAAFALVGFFAAGGLVTYNSLGAERSTVSKEAEPVSQVPPKDDEAERAKAELERAKDGMAKAQAILEQADASYKLLARKAATSKFVQEIKRALDQLPDTTKDKQKTLEALDRIEKSLRQAREEIKNDGVANADLNKTQSDGLVWGKEVNGLQLGIGLRPGDKGIYNQGDKVEFIVKLRNVSKTAVKYMFESAPFEAANPFVEFAPLRSSAKGPVAKGKSGAEGADADHLGYRPTGVSMPFELTRRGSIEMEIAPGEVIEIGKQRLALASSDFGGGGPRGGRVFSAQTTGWDAPLIGNAPGKYRISYRNLIQVGPYVSTGVIEIEVNAPKITDADDSKGKIVGVWILVKGGPAGGSIEFTKDGNVISKFVDSNGKETRLEECYKINGNKLTVSTPDREDDKETMAIKTLTDIKLVFTNPEGVETELKRGPAK